VKDIWGATGDSDASVFTREVLNGLLRIDFLDPPQIIWN
jgi:hypothetical protein